VPAFPDPPINATICVPAATPVPVMVLPTARAPDVTLVTVSVEPEIEPVKEDTTGFFES
jgi:hypothetical protein